MFFPNKLHFSNFEVFSLDMAKGFVTEMSSNLIIRLILDNMDLYKLYIFLCYLFLLYESLLSSQSFSSDVAVSICHICHIFVTYFIMSLPLQYYFTYVVNKLSVINTSFWCTVNLYCTVLCLIFIKILSYLYRYYTVSCKYITLVYCNSVLYILISYFLLYLSYCLNLPNVGLFP